MFGKQFYLYIFSFLSGVLFHSIFLNLILEKKILFLILFFCTLIYFFTHKFFRTVSLVVVLFLLGFLYFDKAIERQQKHALDYFANEKIEITLEGTISEKPLDLGSSQSMTVDVESMVLGRKTEIVETKILVKTFDYQEYFYGQKIRFSSVPEKPESFESGGGRIFDYEHFLEKDGIYYTAKSYDIKIIENSKKSIFSSLYRFKDKLLYQIYRYIPKPESSLLAGVLLGEKTALGDKLENDFRTTGLMHLVVLSGYNVSLVIMAVMIILSFLPLYTRSVVAVFGIVLFALLVGAGPTVIRASIMALFIVLAKVIGRPYYIERTLLLAGVFMVLYNPWVLYFDISFQFSFVATYGLIVLMPLLKKKFSFLPKFLALRDSAGATISAQIMVVPLILYYIGDFSVLSILVNMLVLFMVPITMFLGFLTAIFGFFSPFFAGIIAIPATYSLKYILILVDFFAALPFAKFSIPAFSFWWVLGYYLILCIYIYKKNKIHNI